MGGKFGKSIFGRRAPNTKNSSEMDKAHRDGSGTNWCTKLVRTVQESFEKENYARRFSPFPSWTVAKNLVSGW
jgi:hypothetical protein